MGYQLLPNETILTEGAASYKKVWETVGGKRLVLTTFRLFFESHKFNIQAGGLSIDLREIASVDPGWTKFLGFIPVMPNSIVVRMTNGTAHAFVVYFRSAWANAIRHQMQVANR